MKTSVKILTLYFISLLFIQTTGCIQNAENKLKKGIELYKIKKSKEAITLIEDGLINFLSLKKIKADHLSYGENVLYSRTDKAVNIIYPIQMKINITKDYNIISYYPHIKKLAFSNGTDIKIYDTNGNLTSTCVSQADEKNPIKAISISHDNIFFYNNKKIFTCSSQVNTPEPFTNENYNEPFKDDTYNVYLYKAGTFLTLITGIAGKYNLNIIDLMNRSNLLKDLKIASSKVMATDNSLYYISGNAGKYSLNKISIISRKKENIINFENLHDIELFSTGIIFEDKEGTWIMKYDTGTRQRIPFNYRIAGKCGDNPVLKYLNKYYIIDLPALFDKLEYIKTSIPVIFQEQEAENN